MINTVNTTSAALTAGDTVPIGSAKIKTNDRVNLNGNTLEITRPGVYKVDALTVITATAAGSIDVQLLQNGTAIPGAIASGTAAAIGDEITLPVSAVVETIPGTPGSKVSLTLSVSTGCTLNSVVATIERII